MGCVRVMRCTSVYRLLRGQKVARVVVLAAPGLVPVAIVAVGLVVWSLILWLVDGCVVLGLLPIGFVLGLLVVDLAPMALREKVGWLEMRLISW